MPLPRKYDALAAYRSAQAGDRVVLRVAEIEAIPASPAAVTGPCPRDDGESRTDVTAPPGTRASAWVGEPRGRSGTPAPTSVVRMPGGVPAG